MKGFYRAVKRGEEWAVKIDKLKGFDRFIALHFNLNPAYDAFVEALSRPSIFEKLLPPPDDTWKGGTFVVPFKTEK